MMIKKIQNYFKLLQNSPEHQIFLMVIKPDFSEIEFFTFDRIIVNFLGEIIFEKIQSPFPI